MLRPRENIPTTLLFSAWILHRASMFRKSTSSMRLLMKPLRAGVLLVLVNWATVTPLG